MGQLELRDDYSAAVLIVKVSSNLETTQSEQKTAELKKYVLVRT